MADTGEVTHTVLFLHGLGTTSRMWDEHARLLPEFHCLKPDLPGHGSAGGHPWVSLQQTAADMAALIEATPERRAHVVGLSLGATVAMELMNSRPELLDHVVLDGAAGIRWRFAPLLAGAATAVSPFVHTLPVLRLVAHALSIKADRRPGFYSEFRMLDGRSFRRAARHALAARLRNTSFPGPVLLLAGGREIGAARVSNATLALLLPRATAWYLPGSWHAWVGTNPDLHRAVVRAFLLDEPLPGGLRREDSKPRRSMLPGAGER
jgi:pimeloyl-ACP methyl ester carboxylesterase